MVNLFVEVIHNNGIRYLIELFRYDLRPGDWRDDLHLILFILKLS